jgi:hypothetical protein
MNTDQSIELDDCVVDPDQYTKHVSLLSLFCHQGFAIARHSPLIPPLPLIDTIDMGTYRSSMKPMAAVAVLSSSIPSDNPSAHATNQTSKRGTPITQIYPCRGGQSTSAADRISHGRGGGGGQIGRAGSPFPSAANGSSFLLATVDPSVRVGREGESELGFRAWRRRGTARSERGRASGTGGWGGRAQRGWEARVLREMEARGRRSGLGWDLGTGDGHCVFVGRQETGSGMAAEPSAAEGDRS